MNIVLNEINTTLNDFENRLGSGADSTNKNNITASATRTTPATSAPTSADNDDKLEVGEDEASVKALDDEEADDLSQFAAYLSDRGGGSGSLPLLTQNEERRLARRVEKGDDKAREILVNANLRLVTSIAKKYQNRGIAM